MTTTSTLLELRDDNSLALALPDGKGGLRHITLPEGTAEAMLRRILRAQRRNPKIGAEGPVTYTYALHVARHKGEAHPHCPHCKDEEHAVEEYLSLGGRVLKVPEGLSGASRLLADGTPEDLGL